MKVLVVDDDRMLADFVRQALQEDGHVVDVAFDGDEGRTMALVSEYDTVVLDFSLPDCTGLDVIRALRERERNMPILMLTARDSKESVIECLNAGADDYLVKPFVVGELRARVRALARRGSATRAEKIQARDLTMDRLARRVTVRGQELGLTPKEYSLLETLLSNRDHVVTRTELLEKVWEMHFDPGSNVVDVHVARLRAKLKSAGSELAISTVRGTGFVLA